MMDIKDFETLKPILATLEHNDMISARELVDIQTRLESLENAFKHMQKIKS